MNLALGCDLVLTTPRARFAEIFVRRGLTVDFGGTWLLPRIVGLAKAKELAMTGRIVSGAEAVDLGLALRLVEPDELAGEAAELAATLAAGAPLAQRFIKLGLDQSFDMTFEQALAYEDQAQAVCASSEDVVEGVMAFMQKRDPEFRGR
jgi:2-(1,2-epoxy-1,2-dihydrophenyl)acetyl-CoA isomerase